MNIFRKTSQTTSPRMGEDKADLENLLPKGQETPPKLEPLHASEKPRLILGLPVQLVAGASYCAGEMHQLVLYIADHPDPICYKLAKGGDGLHLAWRLTIDADHCVQLLRAWCCSTKRHSAALTFTPP